MKELLLVTFTQILVGVRSKSALSLLFCSAAALLSAFLDALTVTAVIISVAVGFYSVYHKVASGKGYQHKDHNAGSDDEVIELHREDLENFRAFLRSLLMHGAIGTALGGVATMVGEPQNLLIAKTVGWTFAVPTMVRRPEPVQELIFGPEPIPDDYLVKGGGLLSLRPHHFIETSRDFVEADTDLPAMARQYANLRVPVRILYGTEDRILDHDYHGGSLVARHPQIGLELVEGAGHMLPVTRPEESAAFIRRASKALS